ncbi:hypothetical protein Afil01_66020 [Actinorhabdospora filicis]|uniref:Type VII secretion system protein EccE domain-containing protein n=1 Tax=Actinorhabdospora filicis TaxID=1785913 RepID=A0A9W6STR9_9ACTN|nr:type VII secretion protein EccE [Actinorhabdospora filicis]GLZ81795.1 hypothetical protein Afil01_66020 [Actinorhabdospora filicis]
MTRSPAGRARLGAIGVAQLVVLELALAAAMLALPLPRPVLAGVATLSALVLLFTFGRLGGRWWYAGIAVWRRLRGRRRADRAAGTALARPGAPADFAPSPRLSTVAERGGSLGVAFDGAGWYAAMAVEQDEPPARAFDVLAQILAHGGSPVSSVQVLTQSVPVPSTGVDPGALCALSYRELLGGDPTVAHRETWCAARLDVVDAAPVAAGRGGGEQGVHRALTSTVSRLTKGAEGAGVRLRALGETELAHAIRRSVGGETVAVAVADGVRERWNSWHVGTLAQVTYALHGRLAEPRVVRRLWTAVTELPADFTTVSVSMRRLTARRGDERLDVRCLVRLAGDEDRIEEICGRLAALARAYRVRLKRCDGEQGPSVYASALTGGGW